MAREFATINEKRCVACGACTKVCPKAALRVWKGCYAEADADKCVGCGKCAKICPTDCITIKERDV